MTHHLLKAEIHCHLEGAAPPSLVKEQAEKYGVDTSKFLDGNRYRWNDFAEFIACYDLVAQMFRTEEDYALLTYRYLGELSEINTIYSELIISPDHGDRIGLGADAYLRGIVAGIEKAKADFGIEARIIVTGERHFGPEAVEKAARFAAKRPHPLITGFNLAGEERMGRVADYAKAFDIARDGGLGLTIHAGEVCGAFSVEDALDLIKPQRIGHGVRVIEDPDLVKRVIDVGTVLEICPGSNIALSVYPSFDAHPLRKLFDQGIRVCVSSDDPPFFDTSLEQEYEVARHAFGFSDAEINQMTRTALEAAFIEAEAKKDLLDRFDAANSGNN